MDESRSLLTQETWSPYMAGGLLGVVGVLAVGLSNNLLGASGGFENIAGMLGKAVARRLSTICTSTSSCRRDHLGRRPAGRHLLRRHAGRPRASGTSSWRTMPDEQWKAFGPPRGSAGDRLRRRRHPGVRGRHRRRLHQRPGDLRRHAARAGGLPVHRRHVRLRHPHRAGHLSSEVLSMTDMLIALVLGAVLRFLAQQGRADPLQQDRQRLPLHRHGRAQVHDDRPGRLDDRPVCLRGLGWITFPTVPATYIVGNMVGGLIFGVGMALTGYCPGTCVAGAGEGKLDYLIPGLLGFLAGAAIFGLTYQRSSRRSRAWPNYGNVTLGSCGTSTPACSSACSP